MADAAAGDLAGGHADRTIGRRMREYTRLLVLIDDFAMREHIPTGKRLLERVPALGPTK